MSFECPECRSQTLEIGRSIELGHDSRSDEISLQFVTCSDCRFRGIAVYQESRRGGFESESVEHFGYRLPPAELDVLIEIASRCPQPRSSACTCPTHAVLARTDAAGRWSALSGYGIAGQFPIRWRQV